MKLFKKSIDRLHIITLLHIIEDEFKRRGLLIDKHFEVYGCKSESEIVDKIVHALKVWGMKFKEEK